MGAAEIEGGGLATTVAVAGIEHPFASRMITLYVPEERPVRCAICVVSGIQLNEYGGFPPLTETEALPFEFPHVVGEVVTVTLIGDGCVIVEIAVEVHPYRSVTTTV